MRIIRNSVSFTDDLHVKQCVSVPDARCLSCCLFLVDHHTQTRACKQEASDEFTSTMLMCSAEPSQLDRGMCSFFFSLFFFPPAREEKTDKIGDYYISVVICSPYYSRVNSRTTFALPPWMTVLPSVIVCAWAALPFWSYTSTYTKTRWGIFLTLCQSF